MCDVFDCGIDRIAQPLDDHLDVARRADVRRRQQHMVAAQPVHGAAARVAGEAVRKSRALDARVHFQFRIERCLAGAIRDNLDAVEQAAPAHVADVVMVAETLDEPLLQ